MRHEVQSAEIAEKFTVPSPTRGWNAEDPLANLKRGDAYQLDNWIARPGYCEIRKGFAEHVVDFTVVPESFLPYRAGASEKMFAVSDGSIYDTTSAGALGAAVVSGMANSRFQSINVSNDAGVFLLAFNGADVPRKYDGTTWGTSVISATVGSISMTGAVINNAMLHHRRVFLQEKDSLRVWYLPANAISGTPGLLDLGMVFPQGGGLVGMGVFSIGGGGENPQAMAAFVTDQGEVAIYAGNDPSDADAWAIAGVYTIGKPLGRRAIYNKASDLIVVTHDGAISLRAVMAAEGDSQKYKPVTSRIKNAFAMAATSYGTKFGWETIFYPTGQLTIVNVPITELGRAKQFVQSQTGAWSQFIGINAVCWVYVNDQIYFAGTDGDGVKGVFRWDTGGSDNGVAIQCDLIPAFDQFGDARFKNFTMLQPILRIAPQLRPFIDMLVDYKLTQPNNVPDSETSGGSGVWGVSLWGVGLWTSANPLRQDWTSTTGAGYAGAPRLRVISNPDPVSGVYPTRRCELLVCNGTYTPGSAFG